MAWREVARAFMQLRRNEADNRPERPFLVALDEPCPAAIGDDVPWSCLFHESKSLTRLVLLSFTETENVRGEIGKLPLGERSTGIGCFGNTI